MAIDIYFSTGKSARVLAITGAGSSQLPIDGNGILLARETPDLLELADGAGQTASRQTIDQVSQDFRFRRVSGQAAGNTDARPDAAQSDYERDLNPSR